jgi:hypothetical protein
MLILEIAGIVGVCCLPMLWSLLDDPLGALLWILVVGLGILAAGLFIWSFVADPRGWIACFVLVIVGQRIWRELKNRAQNL